MVTLEALFERYRTRGELAPLGVIFDRTSAGLLALAVHLVRDPVEAEDLVQATFVAAIEGAGSFQSGRRLEPWLAGILARQAARVWRQRGRVPEARTELDATLDPSFAAERRELAQALELAFERLAPPEREVLRRFLDGEAPLDIARSQGRGAGAVRMQVLRGLEKLRRLLPSGLHALLPLARLPRGLVAVRTEVLAHAGGAATLAPAALVPLSLGVLAMSTRLILGVLALSGLVFVSLRTWSSDPVERASSAMPVPVLVEAAPSAAPELEPTTPAARVARTPAAETATDSTPAIPAPTRDGLWLVGDLLGLEGLDPSLTEISVSGQSNSLIERGSPDGTFALDANPLGPRSPGCGLLQIRATHPAWRRAHGELRIDDGLRQRIAAGYTEVRIDLDLSPLTAVVGSVEPGQFQAALVRDGVVVVESGESDDGSFALFPPEGGTFELLVRAEGRLPLRRTVRVGEREVFDLGRLVLEDAGVVLEGHFVPMELLREGLAISATRMDPGVEEDSWVGVGLRSGRVGWSKTPVNRDGTFRFEGLEAGDYVLRLEAYLGGDHGKLTLGYSEAVVRAPRTGVEFGRELGLVRFHLRGERIEPPATLFLSDVAETSPGEFRDNNRGLQLVDLRTIEVLVDRRHAFSASVRAAGAKADVRELPAGRPFLYEETFELVPDDDVQRFGALELAWSAPEWLELPPDVECHLRNEKESWNFDPELSAKGCRLERVPPGRYRIIVVPRSQNFWEPLPSFAGTRPIDVVVEAESTTHAEVEWLMGGRARFVPTGERRKEREWLEAELRDAFGERCAGSFAYYEYDAEGNLNTGSFATLSLLWPTEFEPNLAPGSYSLVLEPQGENPVITPFSIVAGELVEVPVRAD